MGHDKALLPFGDGNLLQHALAITRGLAAKTYIVGPEEHYAHFGDVVEDVYPGCGPLAGIHAALSATGTDLNLILSVDTPLLTAPFLCWLVAQARNAPQWITVPDADGGPQPLCAVYRRAVRDAAERALAKGEYKIGRLFSQLPTRIIKEQEILAAGFSPEIFRNINTPEEYEQCQP